MTRKIYRTAQGKMVDLGALQLRNEDVRAVGNMKVNARGDLVDSGNRPVETRNQQVARQYQKQAKTDDRVFASAKEAKQQKQKQPEAPVQTPVENDTPSTETASSGLAAAIARARQIKQDPIKSPQQIAQEAPGVPKI